MGDSVKKIFTVTSNIGRFEGLKFNILPIVHNLFLDIQVNNFLQQFSVLFSQLISGK